MCDTSYFLLQSLFAHLLLKDTLTDGRRYYWEVKRSLEELQKRNFKNSWSLFKKEAVDEGICMVADK